MRVCPLFPIRPIFKRLIHRSSQSLAPIQEYDEEKKQSEIESDNRLHFGPVNASFVALLFQNKVTFLLIYDDSRGLRPVTKGCSEHMNGSQYLSLGDRTK